MTFQNDKAELLKHATEISCSVFMGYCTNCSDNQQKVSQPLTAQCSCTDSNKYFTGCTIKNGPWSQGKNSRDLQDCSIFFSNL